MYVINKLDSVPVVRILFGIWNPSAWNWTWLTWIYAGAFEKCVDHAEGVLDHA